MTGTPGNLTDGPYWDAQYPAGQPGAAWCPRGHDHVALGAALLRAVGTAASPARILEVGCGGSAWLPWLARRVGAEAHGIDWSRPGCERARERLRAAELPDTGILQADLGALPPGLGTFDVVYSLGFVEHFTDLPGVVRRLAGLVAPGGCLFTAVPNLRSLHGLAMEAWQPGVLGMHRPVSCDDLVVAHRRAGLGAVMAGRVGWASGGIVGWERPALPMLTGTGRLLQRIAGRGDRWLRPWAARPGPAALAPFLACWGRLPAEDTLG